MWRRGKIGTTEETATAFWIVVPPVTFENGFTITVTDSDEKYFIKLTSTVLSIDRNTIQPLTASEVNREDFVYDALSSPDGSTFRRLVGNFLRNNSHLTKIKFVANSHTISETILSTDEDGTNGYLVTNGEWLELHTSAKEFVADANCSTMFYFGENTPYAITTIDFNDCFNTEKVTTMQNMFCKCKSLSRLDLSCFKTDKVTDMAGMFNGCYSLSFVDISNFNTEAVTNMGAMFANCNTLSALQIDHFCTNNVTSMNAMFYGCSSLDELDLSNFETEKVTNMSSMFYECLFLSSLKLNNFDTSNVIDMQYIFEKCSLLALLNISNFDTYNVTNMAQMFSHCYNLTSLDLTSFSFKNDVVVSNMFANIGSNASNKPIPIKVTETGYAYLNSKDTYIYDGYAKFVQPSGEDW